MWLEGNERTRGISLLWFWCPVNCTWGEEWCMAWFWAQRLIYIPSMFIVWSNIRAGSWLCVLQGPVRLVMRAYLSALTNPLQPHSAYAWFLTELLLNRNAVQWISEDWMVWYGSQSVSSPCLQEVCSVLLPDVYVWAGLGLVFLIIHETSKGHKTSQHHAGSLSRPMVGGEKTSNLLACCFTRYNLLDYNENRWEQ